MQICILVHVCDLVHKRWDLWNLSQLVESLPEVLASWDQTTTVDPFLYFLSQPVPYDQSIKCLDRFFAVWESASKRCLDAYFKNVVVSSRSVWHQITWFTSTNLINQCAVGASLNQANFKLLMEIAYSDHRRGLILD